MLLNTEISDHSETSEPEQVAHSCLIWFCSPFLFEDDAKALPCTISMIPLKTFPTSLSGHQAVVSAKIQHKLTKKVPDLLKGEIDCTPVGIEYLANIYGKSCESLHGMGS